MKINNEKVSDMAWGDVDKPKLKKALAESGSKPAIKECFLLAPDDSMEPEMKPGEWALPHHNIEEEELVLNRAGCGSAAGRFNQTDFPDEGMKRKAARHLKKHYDMHLDADCPQEIADAAREADSDIVYTNAVVLSSHASEVEIRDAVALINERHAMTPLEADSVFIFPMEASSQAKDFYFTRMAPSSLKRYVKGAQKGVALCNSHRASSFRGAPELPIGLVFNGKLSKGLEPEGENLHFVAQAYIPRDLKITDIETNQVIKGIEMGVIKYVSIGCIPGWYRCSICDKDMMDPECDHMPGLKYGKELAYAWIEDGDLVEVSLTYAGATPGAMVLKAQQAVDAGAITQKQARVLEQAYQYRFPDLSRLPKTLPKQYEVPTEGLIVPGGTIFGISASSGGTTSMSTLTISPNSNDWLGGVTNPSALLHVVGDVTEEDKELKSMTNELLVQTVPAEVVEAIGADGADQVAVLCNYIKTLKDEATALASGVGELQASVSDLQTRNAADAPWAVLGRKWKEALVGEAVAERVRAQGNSFKAEDYKKVLESQDVPYIQSELESWKSMKREVFHEGRKAVTVEPPSTASNRSHLYKT